jgi:hypothetical protein
MEPVMSNGFCRHGIQHLSASSLNGWASAPDRWLVERLLGHRSPVSAPMARGTAVEAGVNAGLVEPTLPVAACIERALATYDRDMTLNPDERRDSERAQIPGYVVHALSELRQYGIPTVYQDRVEIRLDDVAVPLVGYLDWRFDDHGMIVDLKTSERLPSTIPLSHARQGSVYARAHGNFGMRFAHVKPSAGKKDGRVVVVYELERAEIDRQIAALRQIALRLERFLALSADPRELCALITPDFDRFYWSNPATRAIGAEVFGF